MSEVTQVEPRPALWKTAVAAMLALAVWPVASTAATVVVSLLNYLFNSEYGELLIVGWAQFVGGAAGAFSTFWLCERWLKPYSRHVIFAEFIVIAAIVVAVQYTLIHVPFWSARTIYTAANLGGTVFTAYYSFWEGARDYPRTF